MKYEIDIGLRYLRSKRQEAFISFTTWMSVAGIAIGVMALIVVIAVMTGFQDEIRERILGINPHIVVYWDPATVTLLPSATSYSYSNLDFNTTYYYNLFTIDTGGGPGGTSAPVEVLARTLDVVSPELTLLSVGSRTVGVSTGVAATVTFSKTMDAASVAGAVWVGVEDIVRD